MNDYEIIIYIENQNLYNDTYYINNNEKDHELRYLIHLDCYYRNDESDYHSIDITQYFTIYTTISCIYNTNEPLKINIIVEDDIIQNCKKNTSSYLIEYERVYTEALNLLIFYKEDIINKIKIKTDNTIIKGIEDELYYNVIKYINSILDVNKCIINI